MPACPFCEPAASFLAENDHAFAILDRHPVTRGHALVIPKPHVASIFELPPDAYFGCFLLLKEVKLLIEREFQPQGINVEVNCGSAAGQTVGHAHIHLIPGTLETSRIRGEECRTSFQERETADFSEDYLTSIIQIIDHGLKTNSYKFAVLLALAEYGSQRPTSDRIPFSWLTDRFLAYYWPLTVTFRVRQATDPTRDPVIMRFIREENCTLGLGPSCRFQDRRDKHPKRYRELLEKCCARGSCFDEVIPRFHNVRHGRAAIDQVYKQVNDGPILNDSARQFLTSHHRVLILLAIGGWVRFTEQYSFATRLYEKIAGAPPERKHERYRAYFVALQGSRCFYCGVESTQLHIDHFVPWSFVLEGRIWNLILACRNCNSAKSDRTPDDETLVELTKGRNSALIRVLQTDHLPNESAVVRRDLQGFSHETLHAHIAAMAENCRIDGFGVWSPSTTGTAS